jgi:hypothetical protein
VVSHDVSDKGVHLFYFLILQCSDGKYVKMHNIANILEPLLIKVWDSDQIPNEWKQGFIIKLPKKGDLSAAAGGE